MKEFLRMAFWFLLIVVLLVGIIFGVAAFSEATIGRKACQSYEDMGIPVQWNLWTGCMANHPEFGWMPTEDYFHTLNLNTP